MGSSNRTAFGNSPHVWDTPWEIAEAGTVRTTSHRVPQTPAQSVLRSLGGSDISFLPQTINVLLARLFRLVCMPLNIRIVNVLIQIHVEHNNIGFICVAEYHDWLTDWHAVISTGAAGNSPNEIWHLCGSLFQIGESRACTRVLSIQFSSERP